MVSPSVPSAAEHAACEGSQKNYEIPGMFEKFLNSLNEIIMFSD